MPVAQKLLDLHEFIFMSMKRWLQDLAKFLGDMAAEINEPVMVVQKMPVPVLSG